MDPISQGLTGAALAAAAASPRETRPALIAGQAAQRQFVGIGKTIAIGVPVRVVGIETAEAARARAPA